MTEDSELVKAMKTLGRLGASLNEKGMLGRGKRGLMDREAEYNERRYRDRLSELNNEQVFAHLDDMIALARIYLEDGAPSTCAARLREAADVADEIARRREAALNSLDDDRRSDG